MAHPNTAAMLIASQQNVNLRYSIAEYSSYSGSYEPQNIMHDRPSDLTSRWSGASVATVTATGSSGAGGRASQVGSGSCSNSPASRSSASTRDVSGLADSGPAVRSSNSPVSADRSAAGGGNKQYIILKLDRLALVRTITFGKFHKAHPCNLRDFKVYGGMSRDRMVRLVRGGLRNDAQPETFELAWKTKEGVPFPVRFIKLVPLAAHSPNYNFSVWYVGLSGVSDSSTVEQVAKEYDEHREAVTLRLILKHLRTRQHHAAFQTLLTSSQLDGASSSKRPFEHPLVTRLFDALIRREAWDEVEACLEQAASGNMSCAPAQIENQATDASHAHESAAQKPQDSFQMMTGAEWANQSERSLFEHYVRRSTPKPRWDQITDANEDGDAPSGRGGHQMCFDVERGIAYLFGGWDGKRDLCDFWSYSVAHRRWRLISRDTRATGGPGPRSCHKMAFDPRTGFIYVLGRFIDYDQPRNTPTNSMPDSTSSPAMAHTGNASPTAAARSTRAVFLPRAPGSNSLFGDVTVTTTTAASDVDDAPASQDAGHDEELFSSGRGGSARLGRVGDLAAAAGRSRSPGGTSGASSPLSNPQPTTGAGSFLGVEPPSRRGPSRDSDRSASPAPSGNNSAHGMPALPGHEADFFRFSTRNEKWDCLSADTAADGGPKLIFDHQMLVDSETQLLYVFGGRVVFPDPAIVRLSGMWRYDIVARTWTFLFDDNTTNGSRILSRVGHSMLLDPIGRQIWILAGQRHNTYLADMHTYSLATGAVREITRDYSLADGPDGGFTQRATIDAAAREIYLFSGLIRRRNANEPMRSAFWVYRIDKAEWTQIYGYGEEDALRAAVADGGGLVSGNGRGDGDDNDDEMQSDDAFRGPVPLPPVHSPEESARTPEPRPRYAAQMAYDPKHARFYLFGGNPAEPSSPDLRLDDFWTLTLQRPSSDEVLRRAKYQVRQQRFLEMAATGNAMGALIYLQTQVSAVVNHADETESTTFRRLMGHLLSRSSSPARGYTDPPALPTHGSAANSNMTPSSKARGKQSESPDISDEDIGTDADDDSEMISASQTLPGLSSGAAQTADGFAATKANPDELYKERLQLFNALLAFFPPDAVEPRPDLIDCTEVGLSRGSNRHI